VGTVLVVEDELCIQELLTFNLQSAGWRVQSAYSAEDAFKVLLDTVPDVALLDWNLPGVSGLEVAKRLRARDRTRAIPIIMLTARADESDKVQALELGADDYVTKPFSPRELLARIGAVIRRRAPELADTVVEVDGLRIDPNSHRVTGHGQDLPLGPIEFRLLHFFMTHGNLVFSRRQLLDRIWGDHAFVEERTVDVHIRRIRSVLAATRHDGHIETVRGTGYRMRRT
jgi:two-component system, OmpR family, phosphate regulon response regulator PhoB